MTGGLFQNGFNLLTNGEDGKRLAGYARNCSKSAQRFYQSQKELQQYF
jgi:hypothetical protein